MLSSNNKQKYKNHSFKNVFISYKNEKYLISSDQFMETPKMLMSGVDVSISLGTKNNASLTVCEDHNGKSKNDVIIKKYVDVKNIFIEDLDHSLKDFLNSKILLDTKLELFIKKYILTLATENQCTVFQIDEHVFYNKILRHVLNAGYSKDDLDRVLGIRKVMPDEKFYNLHYRIFNDLLNFATEQNMSLEEAKLKWNPSPSIYVNEEITMSEVINEFNQLNIGTETDDYSEEDITDDYDSDNDDDSYYDSDCDN